MSFLQIGFLGALAALAIPIIIHLVFRQRSKRVDLGTLRFLRVVLQQNARRRRVMRWLLLTLRLACVALLAVLFARPYWLAFRPAGEKQTVAILIDRSATMDVKTDGQRLIERAVAAAKEIVAASGSNTRFEVAFFDHAVRPLAGSYLASGGRESPDNRREADASRSPKRDLSPSELLGKLQAPAVCAGGTDYGAVIDWARDVLAKSPAGPRTLHIFTDLQQSGLAWSEVDSLPDDVVTHLHDLGRSAVNNIAVTEARPERTWLRPQEQTAIHVTVHNGGIFTIEELPIQLTLTSGGRRVELKEQVKLEPGTSESVRFDLPPLAEGAWQGSVAVETEDDLALDNQRHVAFVASPPYQVLLVDGRSAQSPVLAATYFLDTSLRLAPAGEIDAASLFQPHSILLENGLPALDKFQVVVLADVGELDRGDAAKLARFVDAGGGLLVFGGENVTGPRTAAIAAAGLGVGSVGAVANATDLPLRLGTWDSKHPIFAAFSDPQLGDLARLSFSACTQLTPAADAQVLARFKDGKPAVIERRRGKGSIVWFASSCDRQWSDWTRSRLYLPLMYQLLGHQTGYLAGGPVRSAVLEGQVELPVDAQPGVVAKDGFSLVVNTSPRESETERCTSDDFVNRFGLKLAAAGPAAPAPAPAATAKASLGTEMIDSEFWPWIALALLGSLLVEGIVANRTAA
ncbi:MAG TPA: BatA domain-containing protein [Pirellulaceae bacterium]|nr:BatA domain-containing protein [Pirellulaceae bacterium]